MLCLLPVKCIIASYESDFGDWNFKYIDQTKKSQILRMSHIKV